MTGLKYKNNGHWRFDKNIDISKVFGFIYIIADVETGMMYIGKKQLKGAGKSNKGVESNWKSYTGSSKLVNDRIKEAGLDNFRFYVLEEYYTRGGLSWAETWTQCVVEVPSNNHIWYNRFIDKVMWKSSEIISTKHKKRLRALMKKYIAK
jgi:hypothetical protein